MKPQNKYTCCPTNKLSTLFCGDVPRCFILHHYVQVLATVGPMAAITSSGMTTGFTAVLLPQLEAAGCPIPVTANEAYWVGKLDL
jgi:hypothetical protein